MHISGSELAQFELREVLGEGADFQVFAGRHLDTGADVVFKRPHPTLVSRNQHQEVEAAIHDLARIRSELNGEIPHTPVPLSLSGPAIHDSLFGDSLGHEYTVIVESRARGVPLVGSVVDGVRKHPIGLPMNLFCLNPLHPNTSRGESQVFLDILETVEAFFQIGYLSMDVRPQNVFISPKTDEVSIIDVSDFRQPREATRRHPPLDINDMLLDLFRWYVPANDPPPDLDSWAQYTEPLRSPHFERGVDDTRSLFSIEELTDDRELAMSVLDRIKARDFSGVSDFRACVEGIIELRKQRIMSSPAHLEQMELWRQGIAMMRCDYWGKFLFSSEPDLLAYAGTD